MKKLYGLILIMVGFLLASCQEDIILPEEEAGAVMLPALSQSTSLDDKAPVDFYYIYDFENSTLTKAQQDKLFEFSKMLLSKYPALITLVKELYYNYHAKIKFTINSRVDWHIMIHLIKLSVCIKKII